MSELPENWLPRLRACLLAEADHRESALLLAGSGIPAASIPRAGLPTEPASAAVLVPIVHRGSDSALLLTRRHAQLRRHAGQISFPGGRIDPLESSPLAAALRETREEIGVAAEFIEPIGYLPDHLVPSGFRITPVVALLRPGFQLQAQASEVEEIFELPLRLVLDGACYVPVMRQWQGHELQSFDLPFGAHQIWGATAGMLRHLCQRFADGRIA